MSLRAYLRSRWWHRYEFSDRSNEENISFETARAWLGFTSKHTLDHLDVFPIIFTKLPSWKEVRSLRISSCRATDHVVLRLNDVTLFANGSNRARRWDILVRLIAKSERSEGCHSLCK